MGDDCSATLGHRMQKAIDFGARIITGLSRRDHMTAVLDVLEWKRINGMLEVRDMTVCIN